MKKVVLIFLIAIATLASNPVSSQIKGAYFNYRGGIAVKDGVNKGIGHFSAGVTHKESLGVGVGIGFIQFEQPYFPLTLDICFWGRNDKPGPIIIGSAGYGVYKKTNANFITHGGFTGSLNVGAGVPVKKLAKVFLTAGYTIYGFSQPAVESYQAIDNFKMFTITLGLKV